MVSGTGVESLEVKLNGKTIEMQDGETPLKIRTGQHLVRRGDFEFETDPDLVPA